MSPGRHALITGTSSGLGQAPAKRLQPDVWRLSPASQWATGQIVSIDGGLSATRPLVRT